MLDVSIRLGVLNLLGDLRERDSRSCTDPPRLGRYLADDHGDAAGQASSPAQPRSPTSLPPLAPSCCSAPRRTRPARTALARAGSPPSLVDPPSGCRFHPAARTRWRCARRPPRLAPRRRPASACCTRLRSDRRAATPSPQRQPLVGLPRPAVSLTRPRSDPSPSPATGGGDVMNPGYRLTATTRAHALSSCGPYRARHPAHTGEPGGTGSRTPRPGRPALPTDNRPRHGRHNRAMVSRANGV